MFRFDLVAWLESSNFADSSQSFLESSSSTSRPHSHSMSYRSSLRLLAERTPPARIINRRAFNIFNHWRLKSIITKGFKTKSCKLCNLRFSYYRGDLFLHFNHKYLFREGFAQKIHSYIFTPPLFVDVDELRWTFRLSKKWEAWKYLMFNIF